MSKKNQGPISVAAQAAAEKTFADIKNTVVTAAEGEAQGAVQAAFDEAYTLALARLISITRSQVYSTAYADALVSASTLQPTPLVSLAPANEAKTTDANVVAEDTAKISGEEVAALNA
jgi:hypothetical protein